MAQQSTSLNSCLSTLFSAKLCSVLRRISSSIFSAPQRSIAQISAASLVLASTGLGACYAWSVGSTHGQLLACLFVLFAVGLELAKPLAVSAAFNALRSSALVRGAMLALLACAAITYSLTAELSLVATTRGDVVASREAAIRLERAAEADRKRAVARYERASRELAALPSTRPAEEIQAEMDGLLLTPGADGCTVINGRVTREVCPKVAELRKELARSERRAELEAVIATPLPATAVNENDDGHHVKDADPGAKALATYLALLGLTIAPATLSEWLVLVPVVALEIGSAFAGVLVQSSAGLGVVQSAADRKQPTVQPPVEEAAVQVVQADEFLVSEPSSTIRDEVKNRIVKQLKANGGSTVASERGLARLIGTSKPTVRRALQSLAMAGIVAAEAGRNGTVLRLLA